MIENDRAAEIERLELESELLQHRLDATRRALDTLRAGGSMADIIDAMLDDAGPARQRRREPTVGEDKIEAVRAYVRRLGKVRQADIARELELNSGTVSEALAALERDGDVRKGAKRDRSREWESVNC